MLINELLSKTPGANVSEHGMPRSSRLSQMPGDEEKKG